ncbi:MarR family winged helix-turn-helix transcriptional regulator [Prauserella muralis]|uniref:MarR family transcriptional regulator n=1 Tax=Prauserella muralis TaxID=588067 RepID=A0A2V4BDC9_9PSEU|nr:MarR family transcriptional regulator [Prauserella muralis]PXY32512.1 MarR family transcriptional regulator [Prauserella muralis]TWE23782.1 MarR family transcriptional regulator [Prauserella muralis]
MPEQPDGRRDDLAAMLGPLVQVLVAAEQPVLAEHDLSMWGYAVLCGLGDEPVRTQAALAQAIGADKTRIIGVLDTLQERGLIEREPDPADRRARLLRLTGEGRRLRDDVQRSIQQGEQRWLGRLPADERAVFLRALARLSRLAREDLDRSR